MLLVYSLGLQEELLVEGLVLVAPLVAASPTGVSVTADAAPVTASRLKREVEQVVQAYLLGSSELSRAELGPAAFCYLRGARWGEMGEVSFGALCERWAFQMDLCQIHLVI